MSTKKANIQNDEINFLEIILYLWKQKFLILSFSLTFLIAGFIYGTLQPKIYKTNVTLHNAPETSFLKYNLYLQGDLKKIFDDDLRLNLLSFDNLIEFVEKNKNINKLKSTLKEKNIDIRKYFKEKFNLEENKYTLHFEKNFEGEDFLNDYVIFTKQKTETIFKEQLISTIDSKINYYKQNLKIAEKIDLQNPILKSMLEANNGYVIFATEKADIIKNYSLPFLEKEPNELFYYGTKILSQKLIYLNDLKNDARDLTLNYNLFVEKASPPYQTSRSTLVFVMTGFVVGFLISLIVIFIRA